MDHIYLNKVNTSIGIEYQIVREDGIVLATTYIEHYADVLLKALAADIDSADEDMF